MAEWKQIANMNSWCADLDENHALCVDCVYPRVEWFYNDGKTCQRMGRVSFKSDSTDPELVQMDAIQAVYNCLKELQMHTQLEKADQEMLNILAAELSQRYESENKTIICKLLLHTYQHTRQFSDLVDLVYEKDEKGDTETVVAVFANGGTRRINVTMDSGWRMIQDIANHIDG